MMKYLLILSLTFGASILIADDLSSIQSDPNLIQFEDFSRFNKNTKPKCFEEKVTILEENGNFIAALEQSGYSLISPNGYQDLGWGARLIQFRVRFPGERKIGGVEVQFKSGGRRETVKYSSYKITFSRTNMTVACGIPRTEKIANPLPVIQPFNFSRNQLPDFTAKRWYTIRLVILAEKTEVFVDLKKEDIPEKIMEFQTYPGDGRVSVYCGPETQMDYYYALEIPEKKDQTSSEVGENAVGPTNAADQAKKAAE